METKDTELRTLQRAMDVAGSDVLLAIRLRTTPEQVTKWLYGVEPIPDQTYLEVVDMVVAAMVIGGRYNTN